MYAFIKSHYIVKICAFHYKFYLNRKLLRDKLEEQIEFLIDNFNKFLKLRQLRLEEGNEFRKDMEQ